jgi:hypothetical protein
MSGSVLDFFSFGGWFWLYLELWLLFPADREWDLVLSLRDIPAGINLIECSSGVVRRLVVNGDLS